MNRIGKSKEQQASIDAYTLQIREKSDRLIDYFLLGYFLLGIGFAFIYDTMTIAISVGGLCLIAYYLSKIILKKTTLYQYVLSTVLAIFMAQYIYQMHGLFEMHFTAFIGSAILITYQNWKLQIPFALAVILHHALFGYLQFSGIDTIYFTQGDYMDLQTFVIHSFLAIIIFCISGLWAYQIRKNSESHIEQSFEIGRLQIAEKQKEELKKANMELDKFVSSVSHDLRAPLKSIYGVADITEGETEDDFTKENMQLIKGSIDKLDSFITDLIDYSRNSRTDIKKEEIDFRSMLEQITNNLKYMGDNNREVDLKVNVAIGKRFSSDKSRISIVLNNLISNAIRYQNYEATEPFVHISVDTTDTEANIHIKDNGIGISKELHNKIFEMFYRVTENSVGSGLGLYLVKETVDKLNGKILIDSQPGIGTEFTLNIPNHFYKS